MRVLLLGEQATGKSSLLVAFYGALVNHRAGDMRIVRTDDDVAFLSRGLEAFGRRESVRRTEADTQSRLAIDVAHNGGVVSLELPDRSGEMLKHMLDTRTWDQELHRQITDATGAMLFLRADQPGIAARQPAVAGDRLTAAEADRLFGPDAALAPTPTPSWPAHDAPWPAEAQPWQAAEQAPVDVLSSAPQVGVDPPAQADRSAPDSNGGSPSWSPALMPVDVRTVDLLQALLEERSTRLPLVLIVSAWDTAAARAALPPTWLTERLPLVHQFLTGHADQLPHVVYGVSAQGGGFENGAAGPADAEDPWDRAFLIGPDGMRATFAEPISWLIAAAA